MAIPNTCCRRRRALGLLLTFVAVLSAAPAWAAHNAKAEPVQLSDDEFRKLDTFEAHALAKADKVFGQGDFKRASAEYDSFILEFPKSKAIAYALFRKGRCQQLIRKRFDAIKEYQEVLDYFPNAIKYAAGALYYTGLCHWENGDENKAMKAWAELAQDKDYSTQPLAGNAINMLATYLAKKKKVDQAVGYFEKVAVTFRKTQPDAAYEAIQQVVRYYAATAPNEAKLRAFYKKVNGFEQRPRRVPDDVAGDRLYWSRVRSYVHRFAAELRKAQPEKRATLLKYWADQMEGKFPSDDYFQIDWANFRLAHEQDTAKWIARLDKQFADHEKAGNWMRIIRWIRLFYGHKDKVLEYYKKLDFAKMSESEIVAMFQTAVTYVRDKSLAESVFERLPLGEMSDDSKAGLGGWLWRYNRPKMIRSLYAAIKDRDRGKYELLRYLHSIRDTKEGVELAGNVARVPEYASKANWMKAELLDWSKKYKEAIAAYRAADNPPENSWRIAECYFRLGKLSQAVEELQGIENFFKDQSPRAAMAIAGMYRRVMKGNKAYAGKYEAKLRAILRQYPRSSQSREAHQRLEKMGKRIGGGVEEED